MLWLTSFATFLLLKGTFVSVTFVMCFVKWLQSCEAQSHSQYPFHGLLPLTRCSRRHCECAVCAKFILFVFFCPPTLLGVHGVSSIFTFCVGHLQYSDTNKTFMHQLKCIRQVFTFLLHPCVLMYLWAFFYFFMFTKLIQCVCVCVCERERERDF